MARLVVALVALFAFAASAGAGGSIRAFVLLPVDGRIAILDVDAAHVQRMVPVPRGSGPVAASIDGSRVLVANERTGVVTEIDGLAARRVRTFASVGRPTAIVLLPRPQFGLVRARFAIVADEQGWVDVLDLDRGRIVRRVAVPHPTALAQTNQRLWVASAGRNALTQLDVEDPAHARVVAHADAHFVPSALAPDPGGIAIDAASEDGRLIRIEDASLDRTEIGRVHGVITQLLAGYQGVVWAAAADGRVVGVRARDGHVVGVMHVPRGSRLAIVGGWLAAGRGHSLRLLTLGDGSRGTTLELPGTTDGFAFAVW